MLTALLDDKAEFVELFLQNGLSMREFLSPQILCQLYAGVSHPPPKKTTTRKFIDIWCSGFHSLFSNFFKVPSNSVIKPLLQREMVCKLSHC